MPEIRSNLLIDEILSHCHKKGWATKYHEDLKAYALSYDKKTTECWLNSIGIKLVDGKVRITMLGGYCQYFESEDEACRQLDYMMG